MLTQSQSQRYADVRRMSKQAYVSPVAILHFEQVPREAADKSIQLRQSSLQVRVLQDGGKVIERLSDRDLTFP